MTPTPAQVRRAWSVVPPQFAAHVLDKGHGLGAAAAEVAALVVVSAGSMSREDFLTRYATTLGPLVLIPFRPGEPHAFFDFVDQVATLAHEIQHVVQWRAAKVGFPAEYLTSSRARALFEVDASKPGILMRHLLEPLRGSAHELAKHYASKLGKAYRCDDSDVELARTLLLPFVASVLSGATSHRDYPQVQAILDAMGDP